MILCDVLNSTQCEATIEDVYDIFSSEFDTNDGYENNYITANIMTIIAWLPFIDTIFVWEEQPHYNKPVIGKTRDAHIDVKLLNKETISFYTGLENELQDLIQNRHK